MLCEPLRQRSSMSTDNVLDDVWGSDTDSDGDNLSYDLKKLKDNHNKRGYLDGVTDSKEANLQSGFDDGFPTGAALGLEVGRLVGLLQGLASKYGASDASLIEDLDAIQKDLRIDKVLSKSHFSSDLELQGEHSLVAKWRATVKMHCDAYSVHTSL